MPNATITARIEAFRTPVGGSPALKAAVVAKFARDNGLAYQPSEVIAATGAKQILFNALLATLNAGDEAIVVAPFWVSYTEMVRLSGEHAGGGQAGRRDPRHLRQRQQPQDRTGRGLPG